MQNVTHFEDYAVVGALDADNPAYAGAYTLWYQNTTLVCKSLVTNECIIAKGQDQCVIEIINAALDAGAGASSGVPVVAIAVPVVLGGQSWQQLFDDVCMSRCLAAMAR